MNRGTIIANIKHAELLDDWHAVVEASYKHDLRPLDHAYLFLDKDEIVQVALVYCAPNNNSHHNTDWFLCTIEPARLQHFIVQADMFHHVKPARGICMTFWKRGFWQEMATSEYKFGGS